MTIHLETKGEWAMLILCFLLLVSLIVAAVVHFHKPQDKPEGFDDWENAMFKKGYIFVSLWTIKDLQYYAEEIGFHLTVEDYARIIKMIKDDFKKDQGINKDLITNVIRVYVAYHAEKNFRLNQPIQNVWGYPYGSDPSDIF